MEEDGVRHSQAESVQILQGEEERAQREAANALRQAEVVREKILEVVDGRPFKFRPSLLLLLNREAINGLDAHAGNFRPGAVTIEKSNHQPPGAPQVPELVEELCDYVNDHFQERSAVHLCAMTMWRLNWIHPFTDGNGRTSRAAAYVIMCAARSVLLPGTKTIPEQIVANRDPYYEALEAADEIYLRERDLTANTVMQLETVLGAMLATQLRTFFDDATIG